MDRLLAHHNHVFFSVKRVFWIYAMISIFFSVLGMLYLVEFTTKHTVWISVLWLLANIILTVLVYCVVSDIEPCFLDITWILANTVFVLILVFSVIWAGELSTDSNSALGVSSGILIVLGGLLLSSAASGISFFMGCAYVIVWISLCIYSATL